MPLNQQFDNAELRSLAIPYDRVSSDLSPDVRIVGGNNMVVTNFGKLAKRPGTLQLGSFAATVLPGVLDHYTFYQTLDTPPKIWMVASVYNSSTTLYEPWGVRLDGTGTPAKIGSAGMRAMDQSTRPHEFAVSRGTCYIKAFPNGSSGETLGTVIFNGSNNTIGYWGLLGPTVPAAMVGVVSSAGSFTQSTWNSSSYPVTVNLGWSYTYTYKTITGQESDRAPLQTNTSKNPSNTGAFLNLVPKMTLTGNSDTVNVTNICVYRTTDGGGQFYKIDTIANSTGTITYQDANFPDGNTTPTMPVPDTAIDTTAISPTLTSNAPPPSCLSQNTAFTTIVGSFTAANTSCVINSTFNGQVAVMPPLPATFQIGNEQVQLTAFTSASNTGTFTRGVNGTNPIAHSAGTTLTYTPTTGLDPIQASSPIAYYATRFWYAIGNVLFYSGQEEITEGVPEECWPAGLLGNFYRFNFPVVNLWATSEALYIFCTEESYWLRGTTRATFQVQKLFGDLGARIGHPRAICAADKSVVWLTHDLRLAMARGYTRDFISDQLGFDLNTAVVTNSCSVHLARYAQFEKDWIVMAAVNPNTIANCQQWVYDFNQTQNGIWSTPWTLQATCVGAGQPFDTTSLTRRLVWGITASSTQNGWAYSDLTFSATTDFIPGSSAASYAPSATISLIRNPSGNHVNQLRAGSMTSVLHAVKLDRVAYSGDTDPYVNVYLDNLTQSNGIAAPWPPETPERRVPSVGYNTITYHINQAAERASIQIFKSATTENFQLENFDLIWEPDAGA